MVGLGGGCAVARWGVVALTRRVRSWMRRRGVGGRFVVLVDTF